MKCCTLLANGAATRPENELKNGPSTYFASISRSWFLRRASISQPRSDVPCFGVLMIHCALCRRNQRTIGFTTYFSSFVIFCGKNSTFSAPCLPSCLSTRWEKRGQV